MRIIVGLLIGIWVFCSCNPGIPDTLSTQKASRLIIPKGKLVSKYQLKHTLDPYNGGTYIKADTTFSPTLLFFGDGEFVEYDRYNFYEGEWSISSQKEIIHFDYQKKSTKGSAMEQDGQALYWKQDYKLVHFKDDSLILGAQGRHGIVKKLYLRTPISIKDNE
ncbi:MAG: hypothetical protein MRZ79_18470 [Bacteroidia bacterium]|nr:hypothetical protein [Bacteroidia bacterium]